MPYCVNCGVELEKTEEKCPLCNTPVPDNIYVSAKQTEKKAALEKERASVRYIRNRYINISGFCIFFTMLTLIITNLSINGGINWSAIPILSLALLWFLMVFPVKYCDKFHPVITTCSCVGAVAVYLLLLEFIIGYSGWSVIVLISSALACFSVALPLLNKRLSVVSVISLIFLSAAAYLLLLDAILGFNGWSVYGAGGAALLWSIIFLPRYIKSKHKVIIAMAVDTALLLAYLFFAVNAAGFAGRFLPFVMPLTLAAAVPVMAIWLIYKTGRFSVYGILSFCFLSAALIALAVDLLINYNAGQSGFPINQWSYITAACCAFCAVLFFVVEKSTRLREFLNKKLNV